MEVAVIVPTLNAGEKWCDWLDMVLAQGIPKENILVIDSSSTDNTKKLAVGKGIRVIDIDRADFNHGGTRQFARSYLENAEILVYLTQDAILKDNKSISKLVKVFENNSIGAAYGRQLPHINAGKLESFSRIFNYPDIPYIYDKDDIVKFGIKTAFLSNSFAAYRSEALNKVKGFPNNVIFGEDMYVAAKMLLTGWSIAYVANACVHHSHNYTARDDFKRSFDMGVFHARESWLLKDLGRPDNEGVRYVRSEISYLKENNSLHILPKAFIKNIFKYLGYKMGRAERWIPTIIKLFLSSNKSYWKNN